MGMRKMTLKAYVDLLRLENQLRSHKFYEKTAAVAIKTYLRLYDKPLQDTDENNDKNAADLDPSELKKLKNKAKKAKRKAEQEKAAAEQDKKRKELHNKNKKKNDEELDSPAKDELVPEKLARPEDPLEEAIKFLQPLLQLSSKNINTHLLAFEIYYRKGKALLMLRAVKQGLAIDPNNAALHSCLARFLHFVSTSKDMTEAVKKVVTASKPAIELNSSFMAAHSKALEAQLHGAKVMAVISPSKSEEAVKVATSLESDLVDRDLDTCTQVLSALQLGELGPGGKAKADLYKAQCRELFPLAKCFKDTQSSNSVNNSSSTNNSELGGGEVES